VGGRKPRLLFPSIVVVLAVDRIRTFLFDEAIVHLKNALWSEELKGGLLIYVRLLRFAGKWTSPPPFSNKPTSY